MLTRSTLTAETIREIRTASLAQTEEAILAARRAFDEGPWARSTPRDRSDVLLELAGLMERHTGELLEVIVTEVGAPVPAGRAMQVKMPIANLRWAAGMALKGPQGGYEQALPPDWNNPPSSSLLQRVPVGVVARDHRVQLSDQLRHLEARPRSRGRMHDGVQALAAHATVDDGLG